jgi:AraC family transcriptional regulator
MQADIHTLYESDFYRVLDFRCRCNDCNTSKPEYSKAFAISFVRKGNFLFNVFRQSLDSYSGCALVTKPGYDHTVTHIHTVPDECSIFEFKKDFYAELLQHYGTARFFFSNDLHSTLVHTTPEMEFFHFYILQLIQTRAGSKLHIDNLVMDMTSMILGSVTEYTPNEKINSRLKKNHLATIERAREYIAANFTSDISLKEIAEYSYVSLFHFSRLFKNFASTSPHQYLLATRLQHAAMLLRNTSLPVADIAFTSGFNSIEYFTAAFRQKYEYPPAKFRITNVASLRTQ